MSTRHAEPIRTAIPASPGSTLCAASPVSRSHLYPHWFGQSPDAAIYYPYYARCAELGIPMMMQVGQCLVYRSDNRLATVARPMALDRIAIDFPELTIIGAKR